MTYRSDIDGLRAIAIISVVLFHLGLGLPGGFVGVDVFFVISGYLITGILRADIAGRTFSIARFYERRIRRLLPMLVVVALFSTVVASLLFMPSDLALVGKSLAPAVLFFANFEFRHEAGYFDVAAGIKPLLHTWSLAIEEQFYLLYPLVLWMTRRAGRGQIWAIGGLSLLSLVISIAWVQTAPVDAFYLLPARFWELGLGGLLTYLPVERFRDARIANTRITDARFAAAGAVLGLVLILLATILYAETTAFPGLAAILPCGGAALILVAGSRANGASALIGSPVPRFIGRISYSLYLWHWPLIVFAQYALGRHLTAPEALAVLLVAVLLATLSWYFIEQPVRHGHVFRARRAIFSAAFGSAVVIAALGLTLRNYPDLLARLPAPAAAAYAAKLDIDRFGQETCFTDTKLSGPSDEDVRRGRLCVLGDPAAVQPSFAVWGDSHAGAMAPAVDRAAAAAHQRGMMIGEGGCPPLLDYDSVNIRKMNRDACRAHNAAAFDLLKTQHIGLVFMIARWPREVLGAQYGNEGPFFDPAEDYATQDRSLIVAAALQKTLSALTQNRIRAVLVMDVPEPGYDVPYTLARALAHHRQVDVNPPRHIVDERQRLARQIVTAAAARFSVDFIDPTPLFCDARICRAEIDGRPLYTDADHLTKTAAINLSPLFDPEFAVRQSLMTGGDTAGVSTAASPSR